MISNLRKNIPYTLVNEIDLELKRLFYELQFLYETKKNLAKWIKENYELISFLLELSVFYRRIIMPLRGTVEFGQRLPHSLIVGSDTLDKRELKKIELLTSEFENILKRYGIDIWLLDFSDVGEFLYKLMQIEKEHNE